MPSRLLTRTLLPLLLTSALLVVTVTPGSRPSLASLPSGRSAVADAPALTLPALPAPAWLGSPQIPRWTPPLPLMIVARPFHAPATPYSAGHRGVDLRVIPGEPIRSPANGILIFGGLIAGVGVLSVQVGNLKYTFEPVLPLPDEEWLVPGEPVVEGEPLAMAVGFGHGGCIVACVHWGVQGPTGYLDPLIFIRGHRATLVTP